MMKYQLNSSVASKMSVSDEGVQAIDAIESFFATVNDITDMSTQLNEACDVMCNICDALEHLSQFGDKGLANLNIDKGLENLLGVSAEQITLASAQEGLGEAFKNAYEAIKTWILSLIEKIKSFFSKVQTSPDPNVSKAATDVAQTEQKAGGAPKEASLPKENTPPAQNGLNEKVALVYFKKTAAMRKDAGVRISTAFNASIARKDFTKIANGIDEYTKSILGNLASTEGHKDFYRQQIRDNKQAANQSMSNDEKKSQEALGKIDAVFDEAAPLFEAIGMTITVPSGSKQIGSHHMRTVKEITGSEEVVSIKDAGFDSLTTYAKLLGQLDVLAADLLKEEANTVGKVDANLKTILNKLNHSDSPDRGTKRNIMQVKSIINSCVVQPVKASARITEIKNKTRELVSISKELRNY